MKKCDEAQGKVSVLSGHGMVPKMCLGTSQYQKAAQELVSFVMACKK
jgi:hypothetical protein